MRKLIILPLVVLIFACLKLHAQGGSWMWVGGNSSGTYKYGIQGKADSTNYPPPRYEGAYWIDLKGNFWIFGSCWYYNDLWKYDPKTNTWVWVKGPKTNSSTKGVFGTKGVPSKLNYPTGRGFGANCWTDRNGDLWLFGGDGYDSTGFTDGMLQDLWRYQIDSNEWTWMGGNKSVYSKSKYGKKLVPSVSNWPGGTDESKAGWVDDSNNLWMFGGRVAGNEINDLWRYSVSTNQWTYMKGDNSFTGLNGHRGKLGVTASSNIPQATYSYVRWKDCNGNFYSYGSYRSTNDLWKFDTKSNNWTWVWGDTLVDSGKYKSYCMPGGHPAPRIENTSPAFSTKSSVMWNFGGNASYRGVLNDLSYFNPVTLSWTWVSGSSKSGDAGHFGVKGIASTSNKPPSLSGSALWVDSANNLWVFGGQPGSITGNGGSNFMWKFIPDTTCVKMPPCLLPSTLSPPSDTSICLGKSVRMSVSGFTNIKVLPATNVIIDTLRHILTFKPKATTAYVVNYYSNKGYSSSVNFTLHVFYPDTINITTGLCQGSTYKLPNGSVVTTPGIYHDTLTNRSGCDSIINTTIYTKLLTYRYIYPVVCANKYFKLPNGNRVTIAGIYTDTFTNHVGCDSIISTTLKINPLSAKLVAAHICLGQKYILPRGKKAATGGTYLDTLYNQYGCDSVVTTALSVSPLIITQISADICQGNSYTLPAGKDVSVSGIYYDSLITPAGCDSLVVTTLTVWPLAKAEFSLSTDKVTIEVSPEIHFHNESSNWTRLMWTWNGSDIFHSTDTTLSFFTPGMYCIKLKAFNYANCFDTVTHCFSVSDTTLLSVPSAFTPNGDGNNDVFFPLIRGDMRITQFRVYNRWGQLVYDKPVRGWDGTFNGNPQPQGTYIYSLIAESLLDPNHPKEITQKGDVELIR